MYRNNYKTKQKKEKTSQKKQDRVLSIRDMLAIL